MDNQVYVFRYFYYKGVLHVSFSLCPNPDTELSFSLNVFQKICSIRNLFCSFSFLIWLYPFTDTFRKQSQNNNSNASPLKHRSSCCKNINLYSVSKSYFLLLIVKYIISLCVCLFCFPLLLLSFQNQYYEQRDCCLATLNISF